jgi:5-oxoprolinase (ATP-hydrolysing)
MGAARWEFWIDVGGTFTDCLAKAPDRSIRRHKLLSSGVTKGRVGPGSSRDTVNDPARCDEPPAFWIGWRLAIVNRAGVEIDQAAVVGFDAATGQLNLNRLAKDPLVGSTYELRCEEEAPVIAIRYLLGLQLADPVPPVHLRLGTTRGTNALVTRSGARTALVTTRGFGDVLEIGYQARPKLFDLTVRKPPVLTAAVAEVDERVTADGEVLIRPDKATVRRQLRALFNSGIESLAICLLHGFGNERHEQLIERIAREIGFSEVSVSHEVALLGKFVGRAETTVVDAYLNPVLREYVAKLGASLRGSSIRILTSAGGLESPQWFRGKDSIFSGPAGGVVGFSRVAQAAGFTRAIGFDMGGTSTDVSRFDGRFELEYETRSYGVGLLTPMLAIETVAAGGGSICRFDGVKLTVGPESAGAEPGPACYGRAGPLTVTDVNLVLGRIVAERFPFPLDRKATIRRLEELVADATSPSGQRHTLEELAEGLLRIANANMAAAIRLVTVAKGADPANYVLVAFGAAAPQHCCAVARELGIRQVLIDPEAGVLSALGIGIADVIRHRSCQIGRLLNSKTLSFCRDRLSILEYEATVAVVDEGVQEIAATRSLQLRYQGVDSYLTIEWPADDDFATAFAAAHRQRYGYTHEGRPLEAMAALVEVVGRVSNSLPESTRKPARTPTPERYSGIYFDGSRRDVPVHERSELIAGDRILGPAIVAEDIATTVIDPGWEAEVLSQGELLLTDVSAGEVNDSIRNRRPFVRRLDSRLRGNDEVVGDSADPVFLEIFNNHLANIAEQMGVTLRNTASSVNVKERLDFSCAIFTADGRLVANAPHVPVHLGAMEETVRCTIAANPDLQPGDVFATNDPYAGGSHLPDITVVTPVFSPSPNPTSEIGDGNRPELRFFTASRAHHAEIGGVTPGSMPPLSKNLAEEGVLIRNLKIVAAGESRFEQLRDVLVSGPYPTRNVQANLADVAAQVAANRQGANDLLGLIERYGWPVVRQYMEFVQDAAETKVRLALSQLPAGTHSFTDYLETANGASTPICVRFTIHAPSTNTSPPREKNAVAPAATIDFTGTGPVLAGNLNANRAIVTAAVIYTLRLLVNEDIPLNQGVLRAIEILLPICLLNPVAGPTPETTPAVAGGNVETSQRIADVLLGAAGHRGGQPRNDEQRGVRRRVVRILRNHLRRQRRGGRRSGGKRCASAHD